MSTQRFVSVRLVLNFCHFLFETDFKLIENDNLVEVTHNLFNTKYIYCDFIQEDPFFEINIHTGPLYVYWIALLPCHYIL